VVLAKPDLIDKLRVAVYPSIPFRAPFVCSFDRVFSSLPEPCRTFPGPEQAKAFPVPADDGRGLVAVGGMKFDPVKARHLRARQLSDSLRRCPGFLKYRAPYAAKA
jgi:hypothetical protein